MRSCIIPDFENYTIYENGDVYSKKRQGGGGKLKPYISKVGYWNVSFTKDSITRSERVHRLLGICFIPNPDNLPIIDHIDRNKLNNDLSNLRWVSVQENNKNCDKYENPKGYLREYWEWSKPNQKYYFRVRFTYYENQKRKSKSFKSLKEGEEFQKEFIKMAHDQRIFQA